MTYQIEVLHRAVDTDKSVSETAVFSAPLTARSLAKAARLLESERAWAWKAFGPGVVYPKHDFSITLDGRQLDEGILHREVDGHDKKLPTWAAIAKRVQDMAVRAQKDA